MNVMTDDPELEAEDVAELLGVDRETVYHYRARGILPESRYVGRTPVWRRSAIERYLTERPSATWNRRER